LLIIGRDDRIGPPREADQMVLVVNA